jgi:hypothetical protein
VDGAGGEVHSAWAPVWLLAGRSGCPGGGAPGQMGLRAAWACAIAGPPQIFKTLFYAKGGKGLRQTYDFRGYPLGRTRKYAEGG